MKKKKDRNFYLQHKLPWQSEWEDFEVGDSENCEKFINILSKEPAHLVETEYRIVKKEITELKNKNKSIVFPICIMSGKEITNIFRKSVKKEDLCKTKL
jgi:hypothetical protein